jgi:AhpC/TSA family
MERALKRLVLVLVLLDCLAGGASAADVVNPAPGFTGGREAGRSITLSSLRGKPVLLVIAPSPQDGAFRSQMQRLRGYYERMASRGVLCFAAFTVQGGRIPSNIPFILADNPASVASQYGVGKFAVAVIGPDGNLDCLSAVPLPGQRVIDLMENNASLQSQLRR